MSEFERNDGSKGEASCAYFGEGVVFKGSITAPEKIVVHGSIEGEVAARDLLVGPTGTITGKVSVDQADIQGKIFDRIEAKVCLSLRKTGRIEGSTIYGEIEIEKGGVLSGEVATTKGSEGFRATPIPKVQTNLPLPPHVVSTSNATSGATDQRSGVDNGRARATAAGPKPPLFDTKAERTATSLEASAKNGGA
ncbi:MAG TPA: polymer-forming cytoskeletal protein [Bradyrhizobium sp.]|nr:polymer-forming cytoskeletal protein [Bradyrhizobium sp.]